MHYSISLSGDKAYIILRYIGKIERRVVLKCNIESHALGRRLEINRFLVDATEAINIENVVENYSFVYEDLNTPEIDKTACVALLVSPGDDSHDFIETLLRNAGHNVTLFKDRESAINHLLQAKARKEEPSSYSKTVSDPIS